MTAVGTASTAIMVPVCKACGHNTLGHEVLNPASATLNADFPLATPCPVRDPCLAMLVCRLVCAVCSRKPGVPGGNETFDCGSGPDAPVGYNCTGKCIDGFSGTPVATCGAGGKWEVRGACQQIGGCPDFLGCKLDATCVVVRAVLSRTLASTLHHCNACMSLGQPCEEASGMHACTRITHCCSITNHCEAAQHRVLQLATLPAPAPWQAT